MTIVCVLTTSVWSLQLWAAPPRVHAQTPDESAAPEEGDSEEEPGEDAESPAARPAPAPGAQPAPEPEVTPEAEAEPGAEPEATPEAGAEPGAEPEGDPAPAVDADVAPSPEDPKATDEPSPEGEAAEPPLPEFSYPITLGLGGSILSELGFGGLIRARWSDFGAEFSAAVGVEYFINSDSPCSPVLFEFPFRMTASGLIYLGRSESLTYGLRAGVTLNDIYGWGGVIGYRVEVNLTRNLVVEASGGFIIHPEGHDRVRHHLTNKCGQNAKPSVTSEVTNRVWYYNGFGLTVYLF